MAGALYAGRTLAQRGDRRSPSIILTEIRIYFEGHPALKSGMDTFLKEIRERGRAKRCRVLPVATRGTPIQDFVTALRKHPEAWNVLLKDSDCADDGHLTESLIRCQGWDASVNG